MKLIMRTADGKEIEFFIYRNGSARIKGVKGEAGLIDDFAAEYIRLKDSGYNEVYL